MNVCHHWKDVLLGQGPAGCLREADPKYEMDFSDIGEQPLHWCSACGPREHALQESIMSAMADRPELKEKLRAAIDEANQKQRS